MNFYRYALNSPTTFTDPLGLKTRCMYAGPRKDQLVCWNDSNGPSQSMAIDLPSKDPSSIEVAYSSYRQCRGRAQVDAGLKVCKPAMNMNGRFMNGPFADDFGKKAQPAVDVTISIDFQTARDCLQKYPLAALSSQFDETETLNPNDMGAQALDPFYKQLPWAW